MTYYVAEIRFNRKNRNLKRDRGMRKRLTLRLITLLLISLVVSASIVIISAAACKNKPARCFCGDDDHEDDHDNCDDNWWHCKPCWWCCKPCWWHCRPRGLVISSLKRLWCIVSKLPEEAFKDPENAEEQRETLCSMIGTVIGLIKDRECQEALNQLEEIKDLIREWIRHCWQSCLIRKVNCIIWLIKWIFCRDCKPPDLKPPKIVTVLRYPETPNYDEPVTVIAQVTDEQSGVKSVILSYHVDSGSWIDTAMNLTDGLYVAEIPLLPYDSAVDYKVYAYDWACNSAVSETYSYVVVDSYPPVISCVYHTPPSPNYDESVSVFATVTEPENASGVQSVTLNYRDGSVWTTIDMTREGDVYDATIPPLPYGTTVEYQINASDLARNWVTSCVYSYVVDDRNPPIISDVEYAPTSPNYDESVTINATVVDEGSAIESVILHYSTNSIDWMNMSMNPLGDNLYTAEISPKPYGTTVIFYVYASDEAGNSGVSQPHFYTVVDPYPPTISDVEHEPTSPNYNETVTVSAVVTEPQNASQVGFVFLGYWDGSMWRNLTMTLSGGRYVATIPALPYGTVANYTVYAFDKAGNLAVSDVYSYSVTDSYSPTARIDEPTEGSYLSGETIVKGFGSDDNFDKMELYIDEILVETWTAAGACIYIWDTTTYDDGSHTIKIIVYDKAENTEYETVTVTVDNTPPSIGTPTWNPEEPSADQEVTVNVTVTDPVSGVKNVTLWYMTDEEWQFVEMAQTNGYWTAVIPEQSKDTTVEFYIEAYDNAGNSAETEIYEYTVKSPTPFTLAMLTAIGLGIAALTATLLYALYRKSKRKGGSAANPGNKPKPIVTLYVPAKILGRFELKPLSLRKR